MKFTWITFVALATVTDVVLAVTQQVITKSLRDHLFADYDIELLPICQTGQNVTLNVDMALRQIMDINEREQVMTNNIWMRLTWKDCRLTWDPASYGNITNVAVLFSNVWIPDITLYDSAAEEVMFPGFENYRATIYSDGTVVYNFPTVVKSVCRVNVRYFPFDTQRCSLQFGSWSHHGGELDIVNKNPQGDISNFVANSEWLVDELPVERHVLYYNCCPEPYPDVTYYLVISRRPAFYLLTMIFPCILTSCVAALVFLLPVESGEKVSLEITVLLSLAVFLLLVSESLPPSSDNFPIIGTYFASSMVLVSLSLLQTVIVLNMFYRGTTGRKIPRWARVIVFDYLGRLLCYGFSQSNRVHNKDQEASKNKLPLDVELTPNHIKSDHPLENGRLPELDVDVPNGTGPRLRTLRPNLLDPVYDAVSRQTEVINQIHRIVEDHDKTDKQNSEWRDFANILDRLFFILYSLVMCITSLSFILQCVNG